MEDRVSIFQRFEAKVSPEPNSGCHLWTAHTSKNGYGRFGVNGRVEDAHRVSYGMYVGPIPDGMCVLHKCDVRSCVRPEHLFIGTQQENLRDMTIKGRRSCARGEKSGAAKLTQEKVAEIRADKRSHREIAIAYGVGKTTIGAIKSGKYWRSS